MAGIGLGGGGAGGVDTEEAGNWIDAFGVDASGGWSWGGGAVAQDKKDGGAAQDQASGQEEDGLPAGMQMGRRGGFDHCLQEGFATGAASRERRPRAAPLR